MDSSALVEALTTTGRGDDVLDAIELSVVLAPDIVDAEVMHALKGLERGEVVPRDLVELAVARLITGPVRRVSSRSLAHRAWALRHDLSVYDALYVALATQHDATLLTADRGMATAAMDVGVTVTLV